MTDLSTTYLGLKLRNPLVVSSSSLTDSVDKLQRLEEAGAGAVVLKSIFEEQITLEAEKLDSTLSAGAGFAEASSGYFADIPMEMGPREYVQLVQNAKKALKIPVMASINCVQAQNWASYAKELEQAGADALELNVYFVPTSTSRTGSEIEKTYFEIIERVRKEVKLPIAVKLSPFLSSIPNMVSEVAKRGANGVVLFNRFYQPNIDIDDLALSSALHLSRPEDSLLPLRWIALLSDKVAVDFAATSGVHDGRTAIKMVLAGAKAVQVCSAIFKNKAPHLGVMLREIEGWLKEKEYATIEEIRGIMSQKTAPNPDGFERAQYIKVLVGHD